MGPEGQGSCHPIRREFHGGGVPALWALSSGQVSSWRVMMTITY